MDGSRKIGFDLSRLSGIGRREHLESGEFQHDDDGLHHKRIVFHNQNGFQRVFEPLRHAFAGGMPDSEPQPPQRIGIRSLCGYEPYLIEIYAKVQFVAVHNCSFPYIFFASASGYTVVSGSTVAPERTRQAGDRLLHEQPMRAGQPVQKHI